MPDAQIEELVRKEFQEYMDTPKSNNYSFGISAPIFCSKLESIVGTGVNGSLEVEFDSYGSKPDYVFFDKSSDNVEIGINRRYYNGFSLACIGKVSDLSVDGKKYEVMICSSEIARNEASSINDFMLKVTDKACGRECAVKERFAINDRKDVWRFVGNVFNDVAGYLKKEGMPEEENVRDIIIKDKPCLGIYFADPEKSVIIDRDNFYLSPHNDGFFLWYKGINADNSPDFYHDAYNRPWIDDTIAGIFENLYEKDVFNILQLEGGDIQKKLDVCMRIFDNKQRLENVYPVSKITV